ncbi:2222_t:CDS:2 [Ambispora gerdemannii]|uniref:RNA helicase n=1 Tax=Ambispora gerdemannii TaxID=144530 RepID=A0A9N9B2K8_9GLOM|nr:2222_t:CDS:2 [Ambispora gerdemannii]
MVNDFIMTLEASDSEVEDLTPNPIKEQEETEASPPKNSKKAAENKKKKNKKKQNDTKKQEINSGGGDSTGNNNTSTKQSYTSAKQSSETKDKKIIVPVIETDTFNPEFTFDIEGGSALAGLKQTWDFAAAKAALKLKNSTRVSIDEIIAKIKGDKNGNAKKSSTVSSNTTVLANGKNKKSTSSTNGKSSSKKKKDNDDERGGVAADGFGGGVRFSNDKEETDDDDSEEAAISSDEESDDNKDDYIQENDDITSEEENEYEKERKKAFFADESELNHQSDLIDSFQSMNLSRPILKGLSQLGFVQPTPIQVQTIPIALMGKDICGGAITGSGKTAAFIVPILERLLYRPKQNQTIRVLILAPTRELAIQCHSVATKIASFTDTTFCLCVVPVVTQLRECVVPRVWGMGVVPRGLSLKIQEAELRQQPDVVIATPGRLIDHIRNSISFSLDTIEILIIDEADRMLEDGFSAELNEIIKSCPKSRQTMLFSATMTDNVDELIRLSLNRPVRIMVDPAKATAPRLTQEFIRIRKHREDDRQAILLALCCRTFKTRVIIFLKSKALAHEMKIVFGLMGLKAAELHGNLSQEQRLEALEAFRDGKVDFLLATDLASRGLDIKGIETVINFDMPQNYAHYLHRVGRTARAGRNGRSVTLSGESDRKILKTIIKHATTKQQIKRRVVPIEVTTKYIKKLSSLREKVAQVLMEEKQEKEVRQAEMEITKNENLLKHDQEIYSRPARTWFQTAREKQRAKEVAQEKYKFQIENGVDSNNSKKRKRDNGKNAIAAVIPKPKVKRDKYSGMSRVKRRRLQFQ